MSVIAVKVEPAKITIAADSILCRAFSKRNNPKDFTKINKTNDMVIGGCGAAQEISLLWHYMETHKPRTPTVKDVLTFFVEFAKWKCEYGDGNEIKNEYILVYDNHAFMISSLFIHEITDYAAIGIGEDFANAALYLGHTPEEAVKVACELCCFVAEPIIVHTIEKKWKVRVDPNITP